MLVVAVLFMQGFVSCNSAPKKADEKTAEVEKELFVGLHFFRFATIWIKMLPEQLKLLAKADTSLLKLQVIAMD